ncbi:MBL fold metallo-hydrolase [Silvibacterium sp.]|uniref:MBL fold metallo-hydrolase n=1 Tax=Silvibacterium sp. TaxID=1964179 RepID=UPI0039E64478
MMKLLASLVASALMAAAASAPAFSQTASTDPHQWKMTAADTPVRISEHVWMIKGNPNIAVVVGDRSVLVVDTGLGPKMGAIAAGFAAKLAPGKRIFLTTTHFHPEHAAGDQGFPAGTTLIRNDVQQAEVEQYGLPMVKSFADRSEENRELLKDVAFRTPDVTFHDEVKVDLGGGVTVRLLWFGEAHTQGDELTFVEPDATLVSGDVVQNATIPTIYTGYGKGGTPTTWLKVVDKIAELHAKHVVPDHSLPGNDSLVPEERRLIAEIRTSAIAMKAQGVSAEQAGAEISARLKQEHPDWHSTDASAFVKSVYLDPDTSAL